MTIKWKIITAINVQMVDGGDEKDAEFFCVEVRA